MMKPFLLLISLALLSSNAYAEKPPNILLILTDDHGWSQLSQPMDPRVSEIEVGVPGNPEHESDHERGIRFTSGYSPAPLCTPTRRSILCGTTAARSGTEFRSPWVPADHMTIPKALNHFKPRLQMCSFWEMG